MGTTVEGIPIYHTDEFEERRAKDGVKIGVLTVPINIAQDITDKMVAGGIQAVWNFTPLPYPCAGNDCRTKHVIVCTSGSDVQPFE